MFDGPDLWLILESGEMALAALSMDGVCVGNVQLNVRLRSPNWTDGEKIRIDSALQSFRSAADNVQYLTMDDTDRFEFDGSLFPS